MFSHNLKWIIGWWQRKRNCNLVWISSDYLSRCSHSRCSAAGAGLWPRWWNEMKCTARPPTHGRMGTLVRNILSGQPKKMSKGLVNQTIKMSRVVIGCHVAVPRSHWSAVPTPLFDNISQLLRDSISVSQQPPSGNLLPILPCANHSLAAALLSVQTGAEFYRVWD